MHYTGSNAQLVLVPFHWDISGASPFVFEVVGLQGSYSGGANPKNTRHDARTCRPWTDGSPPRRDWLTFPRLGQRRAEASGRRTDPRLLLDSSWIRFSMKSQNYSRSGTPLDLIEEHDHASGHAIHVVNHISDCYSLKEHLKLSVSSTQP